MATSYSGNTSALTLTDLAAKNAARALRKRKAESRAHEQEESIDAFVARIAEANGNAKLQAREIAKELCEHGADRAGTLLVQEKATNELSNAEIVMFTAMIRDAAMGIVAGARRKEELAGLTDRELLFYRGYSVYTIDDENWSWRKGSGVNVLHSEVEFPSWMEAVEDAIDHYEIHAGKSFFLGPASDADFSLSKKIMPSIG